jgi:hypothetical protein
LDFADHLDGWRFHEAFISVEGNSMANKVNSIGLEAEFLEHHFRWLVYFNA